MNKLLGTLFLLLVPALALAEESGSLSFAPPPSDLSVIFLGNLFGVVDGVLHGTGSQMMGSIFGVFNSAVLALGGIIILYTLIVSTMNTAHEGQMLGQKWSSIWIPIRSTLGLALLIPKASGYCLMQIFVMWIVVQGVGAADKVWNAALSYLNRGGVIVQAQSSSENLLEASKNSGVTEGAATILIGQVCMLGIQNQLTNLRKDYMEQKGQDLGPCAGTPLPEIAGLCNSAVPNFIGTVNAITVQDKAKKADQFILPMPNFESTSPYYYLNGLCGTIKWKPIAELQKFTATVGDTSQVGSGINLSADELSTSQMSRAIAIQQMYTTLSTVAQLMVNNDPQLSVSDNSDVESDYSAIAKQQFGVPYSESGRICETYDQNCTSWGPLPSEKNSGVLFSGTDFIGALSDYAGVMAPTLNLLKQSAQKDAANNTRDFIAKSSGQGWILAGSYFWDLVALNGNTRASTNSDTATGLDASITFDPEEFTSIFLGGNCSGTYAKLCLWFKKDSSQADKIKALITGASLQIKKVTKPDTKPNPSRQIVNQQGSSTVYGFINNSLMVRIPGQPGLEAMKFGELMSIKFEKSNIDFGDPEFACGETFWGICLGRPIASTLFFVAFKLIYPLLMDLVAPLVQSVIMGMLMIPLQTMAKYFAEGLQIISQPGVNPVTGLADMGIKYLNYSGDLWMTLMMLNISVSIIPFINKFLWIVITLGFPLIAAWISIMVAIGFVTAFYIPILPYIIFVFGALAWLIMVIEAMVAAPIVALGVTHPEGHDAFGKGEHAVMILMNIFLRPSLMIIGFIFGIALTYVGVWILNAGFEHAIGYIQGTPKKPMASGVPNTASPMTKEYWDNYSASVEGGAYKVDSVWKDSAQQVANAWNGIPNEPEPEANTGKYKNWAGVYAFFFSILIYTSTYLTLVQKAFTLISYLPDHVLRWIGGSPERLGQEAAGWGEEAKGRVEKAGEETQKGQGQISKTLGGYGDKAIGKIRSGADFIGSGGQSKGEGGS